MVIERFVYFGGSFDPPHIGHLEMIVALAKDAWTQKVYVVPTSINPLKAHDSKNSLWLNSQNRWQWMELIFSEAKKKLSQSEFSKLELSDIEISNPDNKAYTIDTIKKLQSMHGSHTQWSLAMGSDLISSLLKWKAIDILLESIESVWIFPRGQETNVLSLIPEQLKTITTFRIMGQEIPTVSSTLIRSSLDKNKDDAMCKKNLPLSVYQRILQLLE